MNRTIEKLKSLLSTTKSCTQEAINAGVQLIGKSSVFAEQLHEQWDRVGRNSPPELRLDKASGPSNVLFFPVWGGGASLENKAIESILAKALSIRNVQVKVATCNRALSACLLAPIGNQHVAPPAEFTRQLDLRYRCSQCVRSLNRLYEAIDIQRLPFSDYLTNDDLLNATKLVNQLSSDQYQEFVYRNVRVGQHAIASAFRVTGRGTLENIPYHDWLFQRHLISAITIVDATERILEKERPDRVVMMHGIYVDHGTISETARVNGVPVVIFTRPYRKNTILLCHHDTYHRALLDEPVELWENLEMTESRSKRLVDYIESRRRGSMDSITYHPNPIEGQAAVLREIGLNPDLPIVSLYTNVMWDAQLYHACNAFPNMLEWVFATIEHFINRTDIQLVIRVHPAEVKARRKSMQPVVREIEGRFGSLPDHIKVVPPESDVSSYDLVESSVAAIIFGTKMGVEIALRGVPVIVAGESFARGKGFTRDAASKQEYFEILSRLPEDSKMSAEECDRVKKYGFHFFFRRQIEFPFIQEFAEAPRIRLGLDSLEELMPGRNQGLDEICKGLTEGSEFVVDGE